MRSILIISLFTFILSPLFGQKNKEIDFSKVDKFALSVPDSETTTVERLASYLTNAPMTVSTEKKIRAIYVWVSQNIHYDRDFDLTSPFTTVDVVATQDADQVLAARKGVCMGYAQLFVALTQAAGLKAEMIEGIIKQTDGNIPKMGHAWVAVRLRKKADQEAKTDPRWYLCDPTWASPKSKTEYGTIKEDYFLAEPEDFIKDHLPIDPMWQLVEHPATIEVFSKETEENIKKYVSKSSKNPFVYQDTINKHFKMDSLKRLEKATWRMLHYNPINDYIWFEVGKVYSNRFNAFEHKIGVLLQQSLYGSTVLADEEKFEKMLNMLRLYCETFKDCFSKIDDKLIAQQSASYSDGYINALISVYRGGYQTAVLNKVIEINDANAPRIIESIKTIGDKTDSTTSSTRHIIKTLDSTTQRRIELMVQYFEKIAYQKRGIFLFQYLEFIRSQGLDIKEKSTTYGFLSQGRMYVRKYKATIDSTSMIIYRTNSTLPDAFFEAYPFLFDVEECALNGNFLFQEIASKTEKGTSNELIPYIQQLKDAYSCVNLVQERGRIKSKEIDNLINTNFLFFKQIEAVNESQLGSLYQSIAIGLWNENLTNTAAVKKDIIAYLNLSESSINNSIGVYTGIMKKKLDETHCKSRINGLEELKKEVLKLKKEVKE
jgi:hypothetical protein